MKESTKEFIELMKQAKKELNSKRNLEVI